MIVALGSDFCPNAFNYNMGLVCHLGCINYRLTPKESISAATLNSAFALGVSNDVGSVEEGKQADLILLEAENWVYFVYQWGDCWVKKVIKKGKLVHERE